MVMKRNWDILFTNDILYSIELIGLLLKYLIIPTIYCLNLVFRIMIVLNLLGCSRVTVSLLNPPVMEVRYHGLAQAPVMKS